MFHPTLMPIATAALTSPAKASATTRQTGDCEFRFVCGDDAYAAPQSSAAPACTVAATARSGAG